MSDSVKVIFDGDLGPLQQKQALAKGELNAFVAESEAEIKGIASAGDAIGSSAQKGAQSFSKYYKPVINDVSRDITNLQRGFERVLGAEGSKAARTGLDELGTSLTQLNLKGYDAASSSEVLQLQLQSINKQLAVYKLELAAAAQANIFFTETEVEAAAASKIAQAAGGHGGGLGAQPLRGYGALFTATGLREKGVSEAEANVLINFLGKMGGATGDLAERQAALAANTLKVTAAELAFNDAQKAVLTATEARSAAAARVILLEQTAAVTDAQLILADNALIASSEALTVAKTEETIATEALAAANAQLAETAAAATAAEGVTLAGLAPFIAVGAIAVAGAAVASKLNDLADRHLQSQEKINASLYKQLEVVKEARSEYEKIKEQLQEQESLHRNIASLVGQNDVAGVKALRDRTDAQNTARADNIGQLRKELIANEQELAFEKARTPSSALGQLLGGSTAAQVRAGVSGAESKLERTKKALAEEEKAQQEGVQALQNIDKAREEITKNQDKRFSDNFDNRISAEKQKEKFAEEQAAKFAASVKQGREEVGKLVTGYKDEFDKLYADANKDNPFATQVLQSAKSLEELEKRLKGVGPELRRQAEDLAGAAAAQQAYTIQVNTSLQNVDLRAQGNRFRNPTQRELADQFKDTQAELRRTSNSTNPDVLYQNVLEAVRAGVLSKDQALQSISFNSPDAERGFRQTLRETFTDEQRKNQSIVDQKLDIVGRAKTPAEQAIADKALTAFAGGLNPDDLTKSERGKIADAFERSAARNEQRQIDSLKVQQDLLTVMKNIDKRGEGLTGVATKGGKQALDITVKDETAAGANVSQNPKSPSQADTQKEYHFDGFGILGGSNQ